jgi:hypothetical protein
MKLFTLSAALLVVFGVGLGLGHKIGVAPIQHAWEISQQTGRPYVEVLAARVALERTGMTDSDIADFEMKVGLDSDEKWQEVEF